MVQHAYQIQLATIMVLAPVVELASILTLTHLATDVSHVPSSAIVFSVMGQTVMPVSCVKVVTF